MEIPKEELDFLDNVLKIIKTKIEDVESRDKQLLDSIKENMSYAWENIYEMDNAEKAFAQNQISMLEETQQQNIAELVSFRASQKSPYFGAIDFTTSDNDRLFYRIGLKGIKVDTKVYIVDWRAPFSELYYNFDVGHGEYDTENGKVTGNINSKRQYKIENGKMVFALESDIKIDDSILQEVLAKTNSEKMKNIVSTIQKEQNQIIRRETQNDMIVHGVAGSGKTSIALHRIAYMLYKHRKTLNSKSILILSPNRFFSDYISNVLPELGEENIAETVLDEILKEELDIPYQIESKTEQVERLLTDEFEVKNCKLKNSMQFCDDIQKFCEEYFNNAFEPFDIYYDKMLIIDQGMLQDLYSVKYKNRPVYLKIDWIKEYIFDEAKRYDKTMPRSEINKNIAKMMQKTDIFTIYNAFLQTYYHSSFVKTNKIKYEDAVPLLYIKQYLYGHTTFNKIKHLLIDEFQDYNPLTFKIINTMFPCVKTILGDTLQSVSGSKNDIIENYGKVCANGYEVLSLNKSYRSTYEITTFANNLIGRTNVDIVQRHGSKVQIAKYSNLQQKIDYILQSVKYFEECNHKNIGILTKTISQCEQLNKLLYGKLKYRHLTIETLNFSDGIVLAPTFLVKGLEFDAIIIVDCDDENFRNPIDKEALYVASTRAMHQLRILFAGNPSKFLTFGN